VRRGLVLRASTTTAGRKMAVRGSSGSAGPRRQPTLPCLGGTTLPPGPHQPPTGSPLRSFQRSRCSIHGEEVGPRPRLDHGLRPNSLRPRFAPTEAALRPRVTPPRPAHLLFGGGRAASYRNNAHSSFIGCRDVRTTACGHVIPGERLTRPRSCGGAPITGTVGSWARGRTNRPGAHAQPLTSGSSMLAASSAPATPSWSEP